MISPAPQFAVSVRMVREDNPGYDTALRIKTSEDAVTFIADWYEGLDREMVTAIALNTKHEVSGRYVVSLGTLDGAPAHPREVYKAAIVSNAAAIILVHNHPSGDLTPSEDDHALTRRIRKAGEILGIELLDHIIVGSCGREHYSFRSDGPW